jgi:hypothetical protein
VIDHPDFGWQSFGGNVSVSGDTVKVQPLDSFRQRVYVAPRGLWLTLDAGTFEGIEVNVKTHTVRVGLSPASEQTPTARLRIEQPAKVPGVGTYRPATRLPSQREAFEVPLKKGATTWVDLSAS